jgi:hypothetical protein
VVLPTPPLPDVKTNTFAIVLVLLSVPVQRGDQHDVIFNQRPLSVGCAGSAITELRRPILKCGSLADEIPTKRLAAEMGEPLAVTGAARRKPARLFSSSNHPY